MKPHSSACCEHLLDDDVAALVKHLVIERASVMDYSLGASRAATEDQVTRRRVQLIQTKCWLGQGRIATRQLAKVAGASPRVKSGLMTNSAAPASRR
jgi:hypothetical protein